MRGCRRTRCAPADQRGAINARGTHPSPADRREARDGAARAGRRTRRPARGWVGLGDALRDSTCVGYGLDRSYRPDAAGPSPEETQRRRLCEPADLEGDGSVTQDADVKMVFANWPRPAGPSARVTGGFGGTCR
jgi:hypothetical protein